MIESHLLSTSLPLFFVTYRRLTSGYPWPKPRSISVGIYGIYITFVIQGENLSLLYSYKYDVVVRALSASHLSQNSGCLSFEQALTVKIWGLKESCGKT